MIDIEYLESNLSEQQKTKKTNIYKLFIESSVTKEEKLDNSELYISRM